MRCCAALCCAVLGCIWYLFTNFRIHDTSSTEIVALPPYEWQFEGEIENKAKKTTFQNYIKAKVKLDLYYMLFSSTVLIFYLLSQCTCVCVFVYAILKPSFIHTPQIIPCFQNTTGNNSTNTNTRTFDLHLSFCNTHSDKQRVREKSHNRKTIDSLRLLLSVRDCVLVVIWVICAGSLSFNFSLRCSITHRLY